MEEIYQCPVCLENPDLICLICNNHHKICRDCFIKIIQKNTIECPICREKIYQKKIVKVNTIKDQKIPKCLEVQIENTPIIYFLIDLTICNCIRHLPRNIKKIFKEYGKYTFSDQILYIYQSEVQQEKIYKKEFRLQDGLICLIYLIQNNDQEGQIDLQIHKQRCSQL